MKTKIQIKSSRGSVLFEHTTKNNSIKKSLVEAVNSRANLYGANLYGANLSRADLSGADLSWANLYGANLSRANLYGADLSWANLYGANLSRANLYGANLYGANLSRADLSGADLSWANLYGANLFRANLYGANLYGANLSRANLKKIESLFRIVPEEGSFIAWKKGKDNHLIKLEIPAEAKRHNYLGGRKCRAEFVKVLDIRNSKGHKVKSCQNGTHSQKIEYKIGEIVKADSYDPSPLEECSNGIHFFLTKQEAKEWKL